MMFFLIAISCDAVSERQLAEAVLAGDESVFSELDQPELSRWAEDHRALQAALAQTEELNRASRELMREAIVEALDSGDLDSAATYLAQAVPSWPEDPAFLMLAEQLGEQAEEAGPEQAAFAWQVLAELYHHDARRSAEFQRKAGKAEVRHRYAPENRAGTLGALEGVERAGAVAVIAHLDKEYVAEPDWEALAAAGRGRLQRVAQAYGMDEQLGRYPQADAVAALGELDEHLKQMPRHGIPREVVLAEWIEAVCESLDPWTRAVWPAEIRSWQDHHAGVTVGVGLELVEHEGHVLVERPLLDTPAWSSGIRQGDVILAMEDATGRLDLSTPTPGQSALAERGMYGELDSWLRFEVVRDGEPLGFEMKRGAVAMKTVQGYARLPDNSWSIWLDEGVAYARISDFRASTEPDLDALFEPHLGDIELVVLDLRGNPGGNVNAAVQVADRFVAEGFLAGIDGRVLPDTGPEIDPETGERLADWNEAVPGHALEGTPVIVLVDGDTASSAEVLAGALQERADALVVGSPTWGKGYAQALRGGEQGWALQLTNLVWTLPSGRRLDRDGGIQPDFALPQTTPGARFRIAELRDQRVALKVHADGSPMVPVGPKAKEGLPPLDEDPALIQARLLARALLVPED